ncbi:MAG: nucleoside monophosphate kinase [Candidatus Aenigmatarchaeota archaeon]
MKIIILGPPGSGKGTLSFAISEKYGISHIEAGKILREEIENRTEIGKKVKEIVESGRLVPDNIISELVKKRIDTCKKGFILDGYPRTIGQAEALKKMTDIDLVINLSIPDKILIERAAGRRTCRKCGAVYNIADIHEEIDGVVYNMPPLLPKKAWTCDKCGGELYIRSDEKPDVIKKRLEEYKRQTKPLIEYYKNKNFRDVLVTAGKDEMIKKIFKIVDSILVTKRSDNS